MPRRVGACNPKRFKSLGSLPFRFNAAPNDSDRDGLPGLNRIHRGQGQRASARKAREHSGFSHWPEPADILQQKPPHMAQTVGRPALAGEALHPSGGSSPLAGDARDLVSRLTSKIAGMPRPTSEVRLLPPPGKPLWPIGAVGRTIEVTCRRRLQVESWGTGHAVRVRTVYTGRCFGLT